MSPVTHSFHCWSGLSRIANRLGTALLLSTGASLLIASGNAQAAETIQLRYDGTDPNIPSTVNLTLNDIRTFVQAGTLPPQVQEFLTVNRQEAAPIRQVLTREIQVPSDLRSNFTDTSVGRFVVSQIEEFVQGSNVAPNLRTAIQQSIQDDRNISLLELIQNYPTPTITLNITGLVQTYNDVSAFVDRVLPALEVARQYLQDIICECEQPAAAADAPETSATPADSPQSSLTPATQQACVTQRLTAAQPRSTQLP